MNSQLLSHSVTIALFPLAMMAGGCGKPDERRQVNAIGPDTSIVIPTLPMSTKSEEARRHIRTGLRYARTTSRNEQAYDEFKRAVAADTGYALAYGLAALAATDQQELQRLGYAGLARVATANPSERLYMQSYEQFFNRNIRGMVVLAESLTILNPDNAASWEILGLQQERAGNLVESRRSYQRVVALDSNYGYAWLRLGNSYLQAPDADTAMAERYTLTGVSRWPNEFVSSFYLGQLRVAQNRLDDAMAAYSHAIEVARTNASGYKLRADLYAQTGRFQQARVDYDAAIQSGKPDEKIDYATARALVSAYEGKFDQSLKELLEVEQAIPGVRARAPLQQEDSVTGAVFEMALRQRQFAVAGAAGQRAFAATNRLGEFDSTAASNKEIRRKYDFWETEIAIAKGQFDVAAQKLGTMERAGVIGVSTNPYYLGMIAQGQKRYASAEREFRRERQGPTVLYNLALVVAAQGRPTEAQAILQGLLKGRSRVTLDDALVRYDAEQMLKTLSSADSTRKTDVRR